MAYVGWYLFGFLLNFATCGWVLRKANFSPLAAALGAFVFTFALPVLHQEGHAQLVYRFAIPVACFCWYRTLVLRDTVSAAQTIFWCAVQFMCSVYLGVFLGYCLMAMLLAFLLIGFIDRPSIHKSKFIDVSAANAELSPPNSDHPNAFAWLWYGAAIGGIILVFLLLRQYKLIAAEYQLVRPIDDLRSLIPRLHSYLLADNSGLTRWIGSWVAEFPTRPEHQLFIGLGVFVLSVLGTWVPTFFGRVFFVTLLLLVGLTVMAGDQSLYLWLLKIPGFDAIRAVSRVILVMLFPVAVLVAVGADRLLQLTLTWGLLLRGLLIVAIVASLTVETVYYVPRQEAVQTWQDRQRGLRSLIKDKLPSDTILFVTQRQAEPFYITELDAVIYAQNHQLATLNGYSGSTPVGYAYPDPCLPSDARLRGYFAFRGLSEVKQKELLSRLRVVALEACAK
jgi:hypothetical protein